MTGKDLIIYILQNNLEDEPVFKNGKLLGFRTVEEYAVLAGVGIWTVRALIKEKIIPSIKIGDQYYIPASFPIEGSNKNE